MTPNVTPAQAPRPRVSLASLGCLLVTLRQGPPRCVSVSARPHAQSAGPARPHARSPRNVRSPHWPRGRGQGLRGPLRPSPDEDDRSRFAAALAVSPAWLLAEGNPRLRRLGPFLEESETLPDLFHARAALLRLPPQRGKQLARAGRPPGLALCAEEFPAPGARARAGIAAPTPPGRLRLPPLSARAGAGAAGVPAVSPSPPGVRPQGSAWAGRDRGGALCWNSSRLPGS